MPIARGACIDQSYAKPCSPGELPCAFIPVRGFEAEVGDLTLVCFTPHLMAVMITETRHVSQDDIGRTFLSELEKALSILKQNLDQHIFVQEL